MNDKINKVLKKIYFEDNNKKIVKDESLQEFLKTFKLNELKGMIIKYKFLSGDFDNIYELQSSNKKNILIDYIISNIGKITDFYVSIFNDDSFIYLERIIGDENTFDVSYGFDLMLLDFLKMHCFVKSEFDKKTQILSLYMPSEFKEAFKNSLSNKNVKKINKKNNQIFEFVFDVVSTYGIIELDKLCEIVNDMLVKIERDKLLNIIRTKGIVDEIYCYKYGEDTLICNLEFGDEDYAISFYEEQVGIYKKYSKKEYKDISSGEYVTHLKSYKNFFDYLDRYYEGIREDEDYIKDMYVLDFIFASQTEIEIANHNFKCNIRELIDCDNLMIDNLLTMLKNIYKEYPKWRKRGNI